MITFRTESGSIYEVDEANRVIRCAARLATRGGSRQLPPGGEWVDYREILHDGEGSRLSIYFDNGSSNPVVTSEIIEIVALSIH